MSRTALDSPDSPPASVPGPVRDLFGLIGNTPLVEVRRLAPARPGVQILAKLESANPGGSVKDRPARAMLRDAEARGLLRPGRRILDATSGNTGIALAMLGAARGYGVTLCVPANVNEERRRLLRAYGAEVFYTDAQEGSDGAIREARRLAHEFPDRYCHLDQYSNPANWRAHFETTGPEIWEQTRGGVTHFVAGLGTSGTMMGTGRYLKSRAPHIRLIAGQPDSPLHGLEGLKHMESAQQPAIYDASLPDAFEVIATDEAQDWTRRLAREEGLSVGVSSGANFAAAIRVASRLSRGVVVTVFCDGGERYLSERFWDAGLC